MLVVGCHVPEYNGLYDAAWKLGKLKSGYEIKIGKFGKDKNSQHKKIKMMVWKRRDGDQYVFYDRNIQQKEFYTPTIDNKPIIYKWTIGRINPQQYIELKGLNVKKREYSNRGYKETDNKLDASPPPDGWLISWNADPNDGESGPGPTLIQYFKIEKETEEDMEKFRKSMYDKYHTDKPLVM